MVEDALLTSVLDQVAHRFSEPGDAIVGHLRQAFPGTHFSICSDDDVPSRISPAAGNSYCRLYYIDSSEHCLCLTGDQAAATGLVVALRDWDDE